MRVPRTLVPENCPTPTGPPARPPKRLKTWLDSRTMIPQEMPVVPFADLKSNIPSHVPLAVLDNRVLISRDMPLVPFPPELAASTPTLTELDGRVVVPQAAHLEPTVEAEPFSPEVLQDLVESDLLVGGEPRLLPEKARRLNWDFLAPVFSIGFHLLLIVLFLTVPGLVGRYQVNPAEEAMNQQNLGYVYLPKNLEKIPKRLPEPREKPSDKMKIDVGELNKIAPPKPEVSREQGPSPQPAPRVTPPQPPPKQMAEAAPQPKAEQPAPPKPEPHLEPITPNRDHPTIAAPDMSPGRAIEQSLRAAAQQGREPSMGFSDRIPAPPAMPGGPGQEGGPGPGYLSGSIQILTPTDGVDFTSYIARLIAIVKRNWFAVMPESARLGDRGRVMLRFRIMRDGGLPGGEPILEMTSGKQPLDRAAAASITASNPFDPLPTAYTRPYIELRFIFLYNIPLNSQ
jgi:outer membrane biosynthesis protein TonB